MGYLNIAGNAMYFESIPSSNLEEQGPGKMKARRPGSSRRLAPLLQPCSQMGLPETCKRC